MVKYEERINQKVTLKIQRARYGNWGGERKEKKKVKFVGASSSSNL